MAGVDDKIVSMKFDNAVFEQRLAETIKSLDKLNQTIANAGAVNGLKDIDAAAKNVNLGPLQQGVEGVSAKFVALSTVAITALATITSRAVSAGAQLVKSLSIQPVLEGFREYETNMNSIQTILANTKSEGANLQDVNRALDQLNQYSDQTIYNFSEMARNIGTFTAAGVGLDQSVNAIKGIANLAAISGSNSAQASTAMYQLSQALAAGKVNLMDWNSVVNAGMGGEVFKKALFETGKAMKTITDVPLGASFEEWEKKGGTFREQMQKGWLTADVLSTTLEAFSGDLDMAGLKSLGFSEAAAQQMLELGELGIAAATEVKTFTQLMSTIKESVASGWSQSFRTVLGDFEEAKSLFTEINNAVGAMVGRSADARNEMLKTWKDFGGRDALIEGFRNAFEGIASIIAPIREAFRDIFPKTTAEDLLRATAAFRDFTERIKIGEETAAKLKSAFSGLFSIFSIGFEILKGVATVISDALGVLFQGSGAVLDFAANTGDMVTALRESLVEGGKIRVFFDKISHYVQRAIIFIKDFASNITGMFAGFSGAEAVEQGVQRVGDRISGLGRIVDRAKGIWGGFSDALSKVTDVLDEVWNHISTWFSELGDRIAKVMSPNDYDEAVDVINIGLIGGIGLMIKRFMDGGLLNMLGGGNFLESISEGFQQLTGALQAMQADLKAKALMKIAIAVGVLSASLLVLSLINSADLAKALGAMTVAFGQLIAAMTILNKLQLGTGAAKLTALAGGLILLASAAAILTLAIRNLSGLGWAELAKGLIGTAVAIGLLTASTQLIAKDTTGLIRAGLAMIAIAGALYILGEAVQKFAEMSFGDMAKGLLGVSVGLGALTVAMKFMPPGMASTGAGIALMAAGLYILGEAVENFAQMSWSEMGQGLLGVALGLGAIALITNTMPVGGMMGIGAGLILVSTGLVIMAKAISSMGDIPFGEMAKGIGGIAAVMLIMAVALNAMTGTAAGAASLLIASAALAVLTKVLKELGDLSLGQLAAGLGAIAAVFVILGAGTIALAGLTPALAALGGALMLVGGAFALFGVGAMLIAKAFETLARAGKTGLGVLIESIKMLIAALPEFVGAFVAAIVELAGELLEGATALLKIIQQFLLQVLETVIELVPSIVVALGVIITGFLELVQTLFPVLLETGILIIMTILQGIRDNIFQVVTIGTEIIVNLVAGLVSNMATLVDAAVTLITSFLLALSERAVDLVTAGLTLLTSLISGITQNLHQVTQAVTELILTFLAQITLSMAQIIESGVNMLVWLLSGISNNLNKVVEALTQVITSFIQTLSDNTQKIIDAGFKMLTDLLRGIGDNLVEVANTVGDVVSEFITALGDNAQKIIDAGAAALIDFLDGIGRDIYLVIDKGVEVVGKLIEGIGNNAVELANAAGEAILDFLNGLTEAVERYAPQIRGAGARLAIAVADGFTGGLASKAGDLIGSVTGALGGAVNAGKKLLGINSPSRVFADIGRNVAEGFANGLDGETGPRRSAMAMADNVKSAFEDIISRIPDTFDNVGEFNPVITPVLDLTKVQAGARGIDGLISVGAITPDVSIDRARTISTTQEMTGQADQPPAYQGPQEIKFEQNIYSPSALSTNDIYRNTKSQIAQAKEELNI